MKIVKYALLAAGIVAALSGGTVRPSDAPAPVRARDIAEHLASLGPWVDWKDTCDTFKAGDPGRPIESVAVSWMSTLDALEKAKDKGCQMFITHEPTFYSHMDDDPSFDKDKATVEKRKLLAETGLVVYRCHDVWDKVPAIGILASWAKALGLDGTPAVEQEYYAVYDVGERALGEMARDFAARLRRFGQEAVQVTGDLKVKVHRLAIGTGAITSARQMHALGADAAVITETVYWRDVRWANDMRFPLIIVSHAVSECPGLESLAAHLRQRFPGLRVEYIQEGCPFRLVGPAGLVGP